MATTAGAFVPRSVFEVRRGAADAIASFRSGPGYRQFQVLSLLYRYRDQQLGSLSYSMICAELGIATKGEVSVIVTRLERRGLVRREGVGRQPRLRLAGDHFGNDKKPEAI